jgi:hypothetical protein
MRAKIQFYFSNWIQIFIAFFKDHFTVGNRVVKSPRSDSSKLCFWTFFLIINTPTKKMPKYWTLGYLRFPSLGLQSESFVEFAIRFSLRKGQLWNQISRLLLGFCSAYIYSFERFFCQLFNGVLGIWQFSSI